MYDKCPAKMQIRAYIAYRQLSPRSAFTQVQYDWDPVFSLTKSPNAECITDLLDQCNCAHVQND